MKRNIALLLAILMVLSLAACGGNANANANANPPESAAPAEEAAPVAEAAPAEEAAGSKDIVVAAQSLGSTLNPWDLSDGTTACFPYACYDRLVKYPVIEDENGNLVADTSRLVPSLASSWETSEDGLVWTFYLDERATFANGDKVTAGDVKWSFENCRDNPNSAFFYELTRIQNIETPDDSTVVLTLDQKCNMFLRLLEIYSFVVVNQSEAEAGIAEDPDYLTTHCAGSGPYVMDTYDTTNQVKVVARDDYWNEEAKAQNDSVTYILQAEASERQLLLENGDVDVALDVADKNVDALAQNENLQVLKFASNRHLFLCMNNNDEHFSNPLVRKAVAYAIPYDTLVNDVMYGTAVYTTSMLPDNVNGHIAIEDVTYYPTNIEKAKELLAEAGYPDGFEVTMTLGDGFSDWEDSAIVIQSALAQIGIKMEINKIARAEFLTQAAGKNLPLFINRFNPFIGDPGYLVNCVYTTRSDYNYFNYSNAEFDQLYDDAEKQETEEGRLAIYEEMQKIFGEDCPVAELYQYGFSFCAQKDITGHVYFPDGSLHFEYLSK